MKRSFKTNLRHVLLGAVAVVALGGTACKRGLDPGVSHVVKIKGRTCILPPFTNETYTRILTEGGLEFESRLVKASGRFDVARSGEYLYNVSGGNKMIADYIACSTTANHGIAMSEYIALRKAIQDAEEKDRETALEYERQRAAQAARKTLSAARHSSEGGSEGETLIPVQTNVPSNPHPKQERRPNDETNTCDTRTIEVVEYLLRACENERRCKNPVPPLVTLNEFERLVSGLPVYPIFFGFGEDDLDATAKRALKEHSILQQALKSRKVLIIGRASRRGAKTAVNYRQARKRAQSVRDVLESVDPNTSLYKYEVFSFGDGTLYMKTDSIFGHMFRGMYGGDEDKLNQSAWVVVYDCQKEE